MNSHGESGFTLLEMVCVLAIISLLAAVLMPLVPHGTSRARLQAYALQAVALLKDDRSAAIRQGVNVATLVDVEKHAIHSGATRHVIRFPDDVRFDALLPKTCARKTSLSTISFFADGMSCGGVLALRRRDEAIEIRVNWLTGRAEVVNRDAAVN